MNGAPSPRSSGRRDVIEVSLGEHRGTNRSGDDGREQGGHHADHDPRRVAEGGDRQETDQHDRERQERFDDAAGNDVEPTAQVAHQHAEDDTEHDAEHGRQRGDLEHLARPAITRDKTSRPVLSVPNG